jgi:hypothetical protein
MQPEPRAETGVETRLQQALEPGEQLRVHAPAVEGALAVTDQRLIVAEPHRLALAVPFGLVRRIQFDVERRRPATLVIVPERPEDEAQVLSIPPEAYQAAAAALVVIGEELHRLQDDSTASA